MTSRPLLARPLAAASVALALVAFLSSTGCGDSSNPAGPSNTPVARLLAPSSGTSFGGTEVTITGEKFVAGSTVSFGGTPGVNIAVESGTIIRATTPAHASGVVDVVVSGSTGSATLPQSFTFVAPGGTNTPPVIKSVTAKGRKTSEPAGFADLSETIDLTAVVEDAETASDKLTYQWTTTFGTVSGSGAAVTWLAPGTAPTPVDVAITLTVVETYKAADASGLPVDKENKVTSTTSVSLHNSVKEIGDMAYDFLVTFSKQVDVNTVMRDFAPSCTAERADVLNNQATRKITASSIGTPAVAINFGGGCPFRAKSADACAQVAAKWTSLVLKAPPDEYVGWYEETQGTDQVTGVYLNKRWYLCESDWNAPAATYHR